MKWRGCCLLLTLLMTLMATIPASARVVLGTGEGSVFADTSYTPSSGSLGVMVIPVQFSDATFSGSVSEDLEEIFKGSGKNGLSSVKQYYQSASYGSLYMDIIVQRVVTLSATRAEFENDPMGLIEECLYVIGGERDVNVASFDENYDGTLDALYLVFAGSPGEEGTFWYPHTDTGYDSLHSYGVDITGCAFLSYEMLLSSEQSGYASAIRETGHLMGLTDYDAATGVSGTGADVMMDQSIGDMDCFSKTLLGWTTPTSVTSSGVYRLASEAQSGEALVLVPEDWDGNLLSEYFMVEYVTPEENQSGLELPETGGVRVWHVDAATSAFTNDVSATMYQNTNKADSEAKLLTVVDTAKQWYYEGETVPASVLLYRDGTASGLQLRMESLSDGTAVIAVSYGVMPEESEPETVQEEESQEPVEESSALEESPAVVEEVETSTPLTEEPDAVEETSEQGEESRTRIFSATVDRNWKDNQVKGDVKARKLTVPTVLSVLFLLLLCFLFLRASKKKPRKKQKRYRYPSNNR